MLEILGLTLLAASGNYQPSNFKPNLKLETFNVEP